MNERVDFSVIKTSRNVFLSYTLTRRPFICYSHSVMSTASMISLRKYTLSLHYIINGTQNLSQITTVFLFVQMSGLQRCLLTAHKVTRQVRLLSAGTPVVQSICVAEITSELYDTILLESTSVNNRYLYHQLYQLFQIFFFHWYNFKFTIIMNYYD